MLQVGLKEPFLLVAAGAKENFQADELDELEEQVVVRTELPVEEPVAQIHQLFSSKETRINCQYLN